MNIHQVARRPGPPVQAIRQYEETGREIAGRPEMRATLVHLVAAGADRPDRPIPARLPAGIFRP